MNTLENNLMIAEFMGAYNEAEQPKNILTVPFNEDEWYINTEDEESARFHESWGWLMPVVERISSTVIEGYTPFNSDQFVRVEIVPNGYIEISNIRDTPILANVSIEGSLINATYKAVVEFIKWYNTQAK